MSSRRAITLLATVAAFGFCMGCGEKTMTASARESGDRARDRSIECQRMVEEQLVPRGIEDERVLDAMRRVPRHLFVPERVADEAYGDHPLPIGFEQTISQPYVVAFMTAALELDGSEKVLEVGTGSGYQAAVLAEIVGTVHTIEIVEPLAARARATFERLSYEHVNVRTGDGYLGWPEEAPFDAIMVTAAPDHVPQPLLDQLAVGGRMILPVGERDQDLVLVRKTAEGVLREEVLPVRFVPMTGIAEENGVMRGTGARRGGER